MLRQDSCPKSSWPTGSPAARTANRHPRLALLTLAVTLSCLSVPGFGQEQEADTDPYVIDTEAAWERVATAREAAGKDEHYNAVANYLDALANDARLVKVVAQEIAYQKLWREDAQKAIFYFNRYLARHPDLDNREVRKGLALAFSWGGHQTEAVALYRQLLAEDPTDGGAQIGLGRSLIWNNQLDEGYSVLREVEVAYPPDTAEGIQSSRFLLTTLDEYTPHLDMITKASWDSDDLDIYRLTIIRSWTVRGNALAQFRPGYALYRQPQHSSIRAPRLGCGYIAPLAHDWNLHAYGWVDFFRSGDPLFTPGDELNWTRTGADCWLTWLATHRLRLDGGASVMPVETFLAMDQHLYFQQANLSADLRLGRSGALVVAGKLADYSDGNTKRYGLTRLLWRREGRIQIQLGPSFTYMDFTNPYPGGYWAPDWVRNVSLELTLKKRSQMMTYRLQGTLGREKECGADAMNVGGISGRVGWRFRPNALFAAECGYSRSSFSSASGYRRTFLSLSVRALF